LATKDLLSCSWASWVAGGKSYEFVVTVVGIVACPHDVADHGAFLYPGQSDLLANAAAVLEVLESGQGTVVRQAGTEEGGARTLGETRLASAAIEHPRLPPAVAKTDAQVAVAVQAVVGTIWVLATEEVAVRHERSPLNHTDACTTADTGYRTWGGARQRYGDTTDSREKLKLNQDEHCCFAGNASKPHYGCGSRSEGRSMKSRHGKGTGIEWLYKLRQRESLSRRIWECFVLNYRLQTAYGPRSNKHRA
jgi:hypothetical protein